MTYSILRLAPAESLSLMRAAANGDQAAWSRLYHAHEAWMKAYLRRRMPAWLRARFDEQDMLQDVFLRLARSPDVLASDDGDGLSRFLCGILHNVLADEVRRHQRQCRSTERETGGGLHELDALACDEEQPSAQAERADMNGFVGQALQRLTREDQALLLGRFVDCLTWVELSRRIGVSEPTARRRGQDALGRLLQRPA
jgi:RNA polymerase sigma factor (sigma-70 family)